VRAAAAARVAVPIRGAAESLNVSVAAGILLYLLTRER
jgi:tRNA G18 (ribose-2'-O)-methylase SpoU